jgi:hypothetical protein
MAGRWTLCCITLRRSLARQARWLAFVFCETLFSVIAFEQDLALRRRDIIRLLWRADGSICLF